MTREQRAELRRLAEAATPGPWLFERKYKYAWLYRPDARVLNRADTQISGAVSNIAYIASANPQAILALLDRVERLEEALRFYAEGNTDLEPKPDKAHLYDKDYPMGSEKWLQRSMSDYWSGKLARATLKDLE